mmetsp:Transcript_119001/g.332014  ORF Transcript_119001/g.332014 Transcript_119001/m.332014 type:complete len:224 (+) Transcript_119001:203-874(+)
MSACSRGRRERRPRGAPATRPGCRRWRPHSCGPRPRRQGPGTRAQPTERPRHCPAPRRWPCCGRAASAPRPGPARTRSSLVPPRHHLPRRLRAGGRGRRGACAERGSAPAAPPRGPPSRRRPPPCEAPARPRRGRRPLWPRRTGPRASGPAPRHACGHTPCGRSRWAPMPGIRRRAAGAAAAGPEGCAGQTRTGSARRSSPRRADPCNGRSSPACRPASCTRA